MSDDLLPPNATPQERALAKAASLPLAAVAVPIAELCNADTCPAALLPWLAWAESVDDLETTWPEAQKRAVIKASRAVHERKGTVAALELAGAALGLDLAFLEWFQLSPPGPAYTFSARVVVDQVPVVTPATFARVERVAYSAKNLRSHLVGIDVEARTTAPVHIGAAAYLGDIVTVLAEPA